MGHKPALTDIKKKAKARAAWSPREREVLDRYVRDVISGRIPDAKRAAQRCRRSLRRFTLDYLHSQMLARAREL